MLRFAVVVLLGLLAAAAQAQVTFDKMKGRGNIVVGYREDAAPFSFVDESKKPAGYTMEFCETIVARVLAQPGMAKLKVAYTPVPVDRILTYVNEGSVDMLCAGTSDTAARRNQVAFSAPIYFDGIGVMVRKKDGIGKLAELKGKKLVLVKSTTAGTLVADHLKKTGVSLKVEEVGNADMAMSQLQLGWSAGYARDRTLLAMQRAMQPVADDYVILPERLSHEAIAIAYRRDDPAMKAVVDAAVGEAISSGKAQAWHDKWFVQPIAVNKTRKALGLPMSDELKAAFSKK